MKCRCLPLVFCVIFQSAHAADQWPQWRGPHANGSSPEAAPPVTWSETSHMKWKVPLPGSGTSTPIVWGDRVILTAAVPVGAKPDPKTGSAAEAAPPAPSADPAPNAGGPRRGGGGGGGMRGETPTIPYRFVVLCVDRATGKTLWETAVKEELPHEGHHRDHGFASASPVTDGKWIWAFFGSRGLHALDMNGKLQWSKDLGRMQTRNAFGEGASPLLVNDLIAVNWDHEGDDFVAAFDKVTGAEKWRQKRDEPTSWATPVAATHDGVTQIVVSATNRVRSYNAANGEPLWECGGMTSNVIPTPIVANGLVYAISGFRGNALRAISLGSRGDVTDSPGIAWKYDSRTPYVPSPLLSGPRLYFYSQNAGLLSCLDAVSGKVIIDAERVPGLSGVYASPVAAAGRVYLVGRNGETVVIKDAAPFEVLATNQLDEKFDASPAAVGSDFFLRGHRHLYCLSER